MISSASELPWAAFTTVTFDLIFHLQGQKFKVKGRGMELFPKLHQYAYQDGLKPQLASLGSLTQPWHLTKRLTFKVNFEVKGRGTGCRPEITSARVPKLTQTINSLTGQLTQPWNLAGIRPSRSHSRSRGGVLDIVQKYVSTRMKWSQATASISGQLIQRWPLTWHLTF